MYKSIPCISRPLILEPKKISFSYFMGKNFSWKTLSFNLEFSFRYAMVTRKICHDLFFISVFDPCISIKGNFLDRFLGCVRSTYTLWGKYGNEGRWETRQEKGEGLMPEKGSFLIFSWWKFDSHQLLWYQIFMFHLQHMWHHSFFYRN